MTNLEKFNKVFIDVFAIDETDLNDNFSNKTVENWDSMHQLAIVSGVEEAFDIMLEPEDIAALTSCAAGKEILAKYDIII